MTEEKDVWKVLKECYDPEIPVNIVDLGLVYGLKINKGNVKIKMTLTNPYCPLGEMITQSVKDKLMKLKGIRNVDVKIVFDPPWNKKMMSASAKRQLEI